MSFIFIAVLCIPLIISVIDFIKYSIKGKRLFNPSITRWVEILFIIGLSILYLATLDYGKENDCCSESATFSPEHRLTIYIWITIGILAFFYTSNRKKIASPIVEVVLNCILLLGIILNIAIGYQATDFLWVIGSIPIILFFLIALLKNQKRILEAPLETHFETHSFFTNISWKILSAAPWIRYPILLLICLPIILIASTVLLLFGQKPDAAILAFTETYKHGFSQLDHLCDNVQCGGHYLCSVAANGHRSVVKPKRLGIRNDRYIICNRQLLVSNAFEELIEEKLPKTHVFIRKNYNKVGNVIHKHYHIFENKFLSDFVYFLMKPLELLFWITLYIFDRNPENRIARQYISKKDKLQLKKTS